MKKILHKAFGYKKELKIFATVSLVLFGILLGYSRFNNYQSSLATNPVDVQDLNNKWVEIYKNQNGNVGLWSNTFSCNTNTTPNLGSSWNINVSGGTPITNTPTLNPRDPSGPYYVEDRGWCMSNSVTRMNQSSTPLTISNIYLRAGRYQIKFLNRYRQQSPATGTASYSVYLSQSGVRQPNPIFTQNLAFANGSAITPSNSYVFIPSSLSSQFTIANNQDGVFDLQVLGNNTNLVDFGAMQIQVLEIFNIPGGGPNNGPTIANISKTPSTTGIFYSPTNNSLTYTLGVTMNSNANPSNARTDVRFEDDLPQHFTPTSWPSACTTAPSTLGQGRTKVTCNYNLGNGQSQTAAIVGTVDDPLATSYTMNNSLVVTNVSAGVSMAPVASAPVSVFKATPSITDTPYQVNSCNGNLGSVISSNTPIPYNNFYDCNGSKLVAFKSVMNWNIPSTVTSPMTVSGLQISNPVNPNLQLFRAYIPNGVAQLILTTSGNSSPYTISGFNTFTITGSNSSREVVMVYRIPNPGSNSVTHLHDVTLSSTVSGVQLSPVSASAEVSVGSGVVGPNSGTVRFEVDVAPALTQFPGTFSVSDITGAYNFSNLSYGNTRVVSANPNGTSYTFTLGSIPGYTATVGTSNVTVMPNGTATAKFTITQNGNGPGNGQLTFQVKESPSGANYTGGANFRVVNSQQTLIYNNILNGHTVTIPSGTYTFTMSQFSDPSYTISTATATVNVPSGGSAIAEFFITRGQTGQVVFSVLDVTSNPNGVLYNGVYQLNVQEAGAPMINMLSNPHSINVPITNGNNTHTYSFANFYDPNFTIVDSGPKVVTVGAGQNYPVNFKVRQVAQGNVRVRIFDRSNNNSFYAPAQSNWAQILIDGTNNQTVVNSDQMYQMAIGTHSIELKASSLPSNYMIYSSALVPLTINNTNINTVQLVDYYVQKKEISLTVRVYDDSTGSSVPYNGSAEFDLSDRSQNEFVNGGQDTFALGTIPSPQSVRFVTSSLPSGYTLSGNALRTFTLQPGESRTEEFHIYRGNSVGNIVVEVRKDTVNGMIYNGGGVTYDLQYVTGNSQIYNNRPLPTGGTETVSNNPFGFYMAQIRNIPSGYTAVIANPSGTLSAGNPLVLTMVITEGIMSCPVMSITATGDPVSTITNPINYNDVQDIRFYISWAATSGTTAIPSMTLNASLPNEVDFVSIGSYSQSGSAPVIAQNGNTIIFTYSNVAQNSSGQVEIRAKLRDPGSNATFLDPLEFTYAPILQGCGRLMQADASHDVNVFVYKDINASDEGITEPVKLVRNYSDNGTFRDSITVTENSTVVEYQIQFENEGNEDQEVDVQDTIGAGGDLEGSNGGSLDYVPNSFEIDSIGDDADYRGSIEDDDLRVTIPEGTKVVITYRARLSAPNRDTSTFTNTVTLDDDNDLSDSAIVRWNGDDGNSGEGEVSIAKKVDRSFVRNNDQVTYTITVINDSGDTENIHVTDSMNAGRGKITGSNGSTITYVDGTLEVRGANFTGDIDDRDGVRLRNVDDGETVTLTYRASVFNPSSSTALLTNTASVGDDDDEVTVSIAGTTDIVLPPEQRSTLSILKTANKDIVVPGEEVIYTVVVRNNGPATDVVVVDNLPLGLTFVSADRLEENNGNTLRFSLGTLLPGATSTVNYVTRVNSNVTVGTVLTNQAQAFFTGGVSNTSQDSVTVRGGVETIPTGSVLGASTLVASGGVSLLVIFSVLGITYLVRHKVRKSRK